MKDKIRESLENILKDLFPLQAILVATVTSVDMEKSVCTVKLINSELELPNVRLRSVADGSDLGLIAYPKNGSKVLVGFVNNNIAEAFILKTSDVSELRLRGDEHGGLVIISNLVDQINTLESSINDLKQVFAAWVTAGGDGGAALKAAAATWTADLLTKTKINDIENEMVKHG
jgi:hypothetical protein